MKVNEGQNNIETITEQWVQLVLMQIRAKKDNDTNTNQSNKKGEKISFLASK